MTDGKRADARTITATLEEPVPFLGLKAQNLGSVERIHLSPATRRILYVELQTNWQTLSVPGDVVTFDERRCVFRLMRRGSATGSSGPGQESPADSPS